MDDECSDKDDPHIDEDKEDSFLTLLLKKNQILYPGTVFRIAVGLCSDEQPKQQSREKEDVEYEIIDSSSSPHDNDGDDKKEAEQKKSCIFDWVKLKAKKITDAFRDTG